MRRTAIILGLIVVVAALVFWQVHGHRPYHEQAYAGERRVTLWSSTAMVRQPVATLSYGEPVEILLRVGNEVQARTPQGFTGWVEVRQLLDAALWRRAKELAERVRKMPLQARGHTKVASNLRIEPGRESARILQLGRNVPVELLERRIADVPALGDKETIEEKPRRREDWWLVRAEGKEIGDVAGWVIGRFVEFDLPAPLPDYATSAGMRVVAWFELNRVADPDRGPKPQYLVLGTRGGEGQACDFTLLRVFTWGTTRKRYETAYVESNLCGRLPVRVTPATKPGGDASFHFSCLDKSGNQDCRYRMHQTIVRRIRKGEAGEKEPRPRSVG